MVYRITCFFLRSIIRTFFHYKEFGVENIPKEGSYILVSNHVSHFDPMTLGPFSPRTMHFVAKKELYNHKWYGWYLRKLNTIPIDRHGRSLSGMKEVVRKIKEGKVIGIFPEGTRSDGKEFLEPEAGAAYFALKFNVPVLPTYIKGTDKVMPKGTFRIRLHPITVYYGKPKRYEMISGEDKQSALRRISADIMDNIKRIKDEKED